MYVYVRFTNKGVIEMKTSKRNDRIDLRIDPKAVAPYVEEKMQSALKKTETIALSDEDQRLFVETLLNPPEPSDALRRAAQKHRELFGDEPSPRPRGHQKP